MDELRKRAKELLDSGAVNLIIGYEQGNADKPHAFFAENPGDASKLIFNSKCINNLAVYLTKQEIKAKGRIGIVATIPVMRSIVQLAAENQVSDENLHVLGITTDGKFIAFENLQGVETYINQFRIEIDEENREIIEKLGKMTPEERWNFWTEELAPCFKCYACRAACPMCYCHRCTVDLNQPQLIPVPSHRLGNLEWHIMRAVHLIGRCINCDACANACPLGLPVNLLNKKMMEEAKTNFGIYQPSLKGDHLMSTYKPDDKENFIQ